MVLRREPLWKATAARTLPLVSGLGLNLVATPLIVQGLGLAQFGVWALTGAVAQYGTLLDLGVSRSVTRFTALHVNAGREDLAQRVLSTAIFFVALLALVLLPVGLCLAPALSTTSDALSNADARLLVFLSIVILISGQMFTVLNGASFGRERQTMPNVTYAIFAALNTSLTTAVALLTHNVIYYAATIAVMNLVTLCAIACLTHVLVTRLVWRRPSGKIFRELASFGLKGQSVTLAELAILQAGKVLVGATFGAQATGAFELGSRVAIGLRAFGAVIVGALTAPLTRHYASSGVSGVASEVSRLVRIVTNASLVPPVVGAALAGPLLGLWLGEYVDLTLQVSFVLCLAFAVNLITGVHSSAAEAIGRPGINARSAIVVAILSIACGASLMLVMGPLGVAVGSGAAIIVGTVYNIVLVQDALEGSALLSFGSLLRPLVVCGISGTAAWLCSNIVDHPDRGSSAVAVLLGAAVFSLAWFALSARFRLLPGALVILITRVRTAIVSR